MMHRRRNRRMGWGWLTLCCVGLALSACDDNGAPSYTLTATVSGLKGAGLTLLVNGVSVPVASGATTLVLGRSFTSGLSYSVSVAVQPVGQTCSVAGGSGIIASANLSNVVVTCASQAFSLGGTITGLNGAGLVLINGTDTLTVPAGATSFTMPAKVALGSSYDVTIKTQPQGLACAVSHGSGTMPASSLKSVALSCSDQPFTVGGTIVGLGANTGLVLINGTDTLAVAAGATHFTMPTPEPFGSHFALQVQSSPSGLTCSTAGGSGTVGAADVTDIVVTCSNQAYPVAGTIAGLTASGLVLANSADTLSVPAGAISFQMYGLVADGAVYDITVLSNPTGEVCTVASGVGVMGVAAVTDVAVTCAPSTVTIGGSISGLGANSGLILLNNGADPTSINANAGSFTMQTAVASQSTYSITIGSQPYGIGLSCSVSDGSGTATADISSVAISCANATSVLQSEIVGYFSYPVGVAVNGNDDLFIADGDQIREFLFDNGSYSPTPVILLSGLSEPQGVTLDAAGNLFVAASADHTVLRLNYQNGAYSSTPITVASGFGFSVGVGVDSSGDVFVSDAYNGAVDEVIYSNGSYANPIGLGSGFSSPTGLALDANGNVFVVDNNHSWVDEIVNTGGTYATTTVPIGSGLNVPTDVAFDAGGNLFVADTHNNAIKEFAYSGGAFSSTGVAIGAGFNNPQGVAVDSLGNVFVADSVNGFVEQIPLINGSYSASMVQLGPGLRNPQGVAVDAAGDVFLADSGNGAVKEMLYANGSYGAPITLASGFGSPTGVALDASGNLFVADYNNNVVEEILYSNGSYASTAVPLGSGFNRPRAVAVDSAGNLFVADSGSGQIKELVFSNGGYNSVPVTVGSGFHTPASVAVDVNDNVFLTDRGTGGNHGAIKEISYSNGAYSSTPVTLATGFFNLQGVAVDALENVFLVDRNSSVVKELPFSNGSYATTPVVVSSGYQGPQYLAVDGQGRLFVGDGLNLSVLSP